MTDYTEYVKILGIFKSISSLYLNTNLFDPLFLPKRISLSRDTRT